MDQTEPKPTAEETYAQRFSTYFAREVAQKAARSLKDGAEIELHVGPETFTLTKVSGSNAILPAPAQSPQLVFTLTPAAADALLTHPSEEISAIGIHIAQMVAASVTSPESDRKIKVQLKAGFLSLLTQGYFGVLATGGGPLASFLASKGVDGMGAIKDLLKKLKT